MSGAEKTDTAQEGWTGGLTSMFGGIIQTVKDMVISTEETVLEAAGDVKKSFSGASEDKTEQKSPQEASPEKRKRFVKTQQQDTDGLSSMERRRLTKQNSKRDSASKERKEAPKPPEQDAQPTSPRAQQATTSPTQTIRVSGDSLKSSKDTPKLPKEAQPIDPAARLEALIGQKPAQHVQKLTEQNLSMYIEHPNPKFKEESKAFPSTYYHPQPSKEQHSHVQRQMIQQQPASRGSYGQAF
eukprot:TRINITY_DN495_c0_g1_i2.p1 TRINITY_DN495_c0_g1~~TRINITY_DN495_c0_g1_i2.p1  ORF type:complete len:241 (-),score=61.60 TRINITY_DN495_c0_g1_i2:331-1053(-)